MQLEAILFDLDDTLLENNMDRFLEGYFQLLTSYVQTYINPEKFIDELLVGTQAMIDNDDSHLTNKDVFWDVFCRRTGLIRDEFEPLVNRFYHSDFEKLQVLTSPRPATRQLINFCLERNLNIVIATNPLFPMVAIHHRLDWAGVPVTEFDYSLVTAYENMHATKPKIAYYEEILDRVNVSPQAALMVGDDWNNDIFPASSAGLYTYWITDQTNLNDDEKEVIDDFGTLDGLYLKLSSDWKSS